MVVIVSREGQFANRIAHASNFLVNSQEHNYSVKHLFFEDYYMFFSESLDRKNTLLKFWGKNDSWYIRFFQKVIAFITKALLKLNIKRLPFFEIIKYEGYAQGDKPFDLNAPEFIKKARSKIVFVHGWLFSDPINIKKYKDLVLDTWTVNKSFKESTNSYYSKYKAGHDVLIGVHIRGGDYKQFEGGKWYYTPEQFYTKMKEIASLKKFEGKKIGFVICTNEKNILLKDQNNFSVLNDQRHFVEDFYLLSKCDCIVGPPSTFSMLASYFGKVPLHMLKQIDTQLTDNNFTPQVFEL